VYADGGAAHDPQRSASDDWQATIEVLTAHAARTLEAITAFKAARALTESATTSATPAPLAAPPRDNEDESARRYARLLISEIKLYHEADVVAGRREGDLASRLAGEINRARSLYDQRVGSGARLSVDHFRAELVRTLADGDEKLLGHSQV
jgi:hypothetical protein